MNLKIKILAIVMTPLFMACHNIGSTHTSKQPSGVYMATEGSAQGTTWHIKYNSFNQEDLTAKFDSILRDFDFSISAYNNKSLLTKINNNEDVVLDNIITKVFNQSMEIYKLTDGLFDPTCRPLVNAWGFAKHKNVRKPEQKELDSILQFVGMDKVRIIDGKIVKDDSRITLNFNANAQGYSVDIICDWLSENGYTDYLVEIGGETRAVGVNPYGQPWRIAIESPIEAATESTREINTIVSVSNKSLCTSGDYRNFLKTEGKKFSHELDPHTGYPKEDSLLSVSILCNKAIDGDALATAVMVMGLERGFRFVDSLPNTEAYMIYGKYNGEFGIMKTKGFVIDE
jgi:thiamine biosynthesis lipoprotein